MWDNICVVKNNYNISGEIRLEVIEVKVIGKVRSFFIVRVRNNDGMSWSQAFILFSISLFCLQSQHDLSWSHSIYHMYPGIYAELQTPVSNCLICISSWLLIYSSHLILNLSKTELWYPLPIALLKSSPDAVSISVNAESFSVEQKQII